MVFTAAQPFTTALIASNINNFKYCWVWKKSKPTGFANAKKQPLRCLEDIVVFYKKQPLYNAQGLIKVNKTLKNSVSQGGEVVRGEIEKSKEKGSLRTSGKEYVQEFTNWPIQIIEAKSKGQKITVEEEEKSTGTANLLEALKASISTKAKPRRQKRT